MPLTIVCWIGFKKEINTDKSYRTPIATLTVMIIFSMGGVFDALLFFLTWKGLSLRLIQEEHCVLPV